MEEVNSGKSPLCLGAYRLMGSGQRPGPLVTHKGNEPGLSKRCPYRARLCKSLWEFEGRVIVGHVPDHPKKPLPGLEGDGNHHVDLLAHSPGPMARMNWCAAMQRWFESGHSPLSLRGTKCQQLFCQQETLQMARGKWITLDHCR